MRKSPDPTDEHVGNRIRMRRLMLNQSQSAMGDALGISYQQVQKYERGINRVGASRLQQIAVFLQVPASFFFEGMPNYSTDNNSEAASSLLAQATHLLATVDGLSLVRAFTQIKDQSLRTAIVRLVEGLSRP